MRLKTGKVILAGLLALILTAAWAAPSPAARKKAKNPPIAVVQVFEGAVLTKSKNGKLTLIPQEKMPLKLYSGDTMVTYEGRAEIHYLSNKSVLRVLENSKVRIFDQDAPKGGVNREVFTLFGHVWANLENDNKIQSSFVTPAAMVGARASEFELVVNRTSGASQFAVYQGQLKVDADGGIVTLIGGQTVEVLPGNPVSKPKAFSRKPAPTVPKTEPKRWWEYLWPF